MAEFLIGFACGCLFISVLCIAGCAADEWENRHGE